MTQIQKKAAGAFRTIREVADHLNVEQHVLRFWETKFLQIKPLKRGGGRRYYRPEDVVVLEKIYDLLYNEKYTIKGAQNVLKGSTRNQIAEVSNSNVKTTMDKVEKPKTVISNALTAKQISMLKDTLSALKSMRQTLNKAG